MSKLQIDKSWSEIGKAGLICGLETFIIFALSGFTFVPAMLAPLMTFVRLLKKGEDEYEEE